MGSSGGGTGASWAAASRPRKRGCPNRADQARRPRRGGSWSLARVLRGEHPGTRRPRRRGRWSSRPWRGCPCTGGRPGCSAIREYDRRGGGAPAAPTPAKSPDHPGPAPPPPTLPIRMGGAGGGIAAGGLSSARSAGSVPSAGSPFATIGCWPPTGGPPDRLATSFVRLAKRHLTGSRFRKTF